jgi:hypothetical protein
VVTGSAGVLRGWAGGLLEPCRVPSNMYAGLTRSADTVICRPLRTTVSVLSVRAMTLCGPLYGGSRQRRVTSCRRKTWVESRRSLWTNVPREEGRAAGVWSQLVHVAAELLYEGGCLDFWGGWY